MPITFLFKIPLHFEFGPSNLGPCHVLYTPESGHMHILCSCTWLSIGMEAMEWNGTAACRGTREMNYLGPFLGACPIHARPSSSFLMSSFCLHFLILLSILNCPIATLVSPTVSPCPPLFSCPPLTDTRHVLPHNLTTFPHHTPFSQSKTEPFINTLSLARPAECRIKTFRFAFS